MKWTIRPVNEEFNSDDFDFSSCVVVIDPCIYLVARNFDIWRLNTMANAWAVINRGEQLKCARHLVPPSNCRRYVFGYRNCLYVWTDNGLDMVRAVGNGLADIRTLYRLNVVTEEWEDTNVNHLVPTEYGLHMALFEHLLYFYSAVCPYVSIMNLVDFSWTKVPTLSTHSFNSPVFYGTVATNVSSYVVGGHISASNGFDKIFSFNPANNEWTAMTMNFGLPSRVKHVTAFYMDEIYMVSGALSINSEDRILLSPAYNMVKIGILTGQVTIFDLMKNQPKPSVTNKGSAFLNQCWYIFGCSCQVTGHYHVLDFLEDFNLRPPVLNRKPMKDIALILETLINSEI
ncbi:hypothetical protein CHUAL_000726 [Chamberlinius hualienensis]